MKICGFEKFSLVDYEDKICCTIFTEGCNFVCPFCHNSNLVLKKNNPCIDEKVVFEYLVKRKNMVDAVCVSGGEPTLQPDLIEFVQKIKNHGFLVKLDTNGTNPKMLKKLIDENLIDYVAMDIKNSIESYPLSIGLYQNECETMLDNVQKSIDILSKSNIKFEYRTTLVDELHNEKDMEKMAEMLSDGDALFLQHFVDNENCIAESLHEVDLAKALKYCDILRDKGIDAKLRGY